MSIKKYFFAFLALYSIFTQADTMEHYMSISNRIPQMEIKADRDAQAWARSARIVLELTCDSIAETMLTANEAAKMQGKPLFCLPPNTALNAQFLGTLIEKTYKELSSQQSDKNAMSVSQIAWLGMRKDYPC